MSRTKKGKKPPGYDYWSKRANGHAAYFSIGRAGKKLTLRRERQTAKKTVRRESADSCLEVTVTA